MIAYWLMYILLAVMAVTAGSKHRKDTGVWVFLWMVFVIFIGWRHQVGGDWGSYLKQFHIVRHNSFTEAILSSDPGYVFVNWWMADWGFGIYAVNFICAVIFMAGLLIFIRRQPNPRLGLAVAMPYLITVVAMGYTRQGVALGFLFMALASLENGWFKRYLLFIVAATLFHKTAILMIPLGLFLYGKGKLARTVAILLTAAGLYDLLLAGDEERLWKVYVDVQMESTGAQIRVWMNVVPALLLLRYRKKWQQLYSGYRFWFWIAVASIASVFLVNFASTAVDRVALYLIPIQVVVFSRLPILMNRVMTPQTTTFGIVLGYALVYFVWLNYATHARYWLPYENLLFL